MELRKRECGGVSFDEFSIMRYRNFIWDIGASIDESVNQQVWATSEAYLQMLDDWDEGKVE